MANEKILGNKINVELDVSLTETPDWVIVACTTDTDLDMTIEEIDATSKCGPDTLAGETTETMNFTGFYIIDPEAGVQVSMPTIRSVAKAKESRHWRLIDEDGGDLYYREFNGVVTAYNESSNLNEAVTFTATISIKGDTIDVAPTT